MTDTTPDRPISRRDLPAAMRRAFGAQLKFAIGLQLIAALLLGPLAGMLLGMLTGRVVLDSTELVSFLLSPRGFISAILGSTAVVGLYVVMQAGLSAIGIAELHGVEIPGRSALRFVVGQLPRLARLGLRLVLVAVALAIPLVLVAAYFASRLLPTHDINFYLTHKPPEFTTALMAIGVVAAITVGVALWLAVRWRLAVVLMVMEPITAPAATRKSAALARGAWWRIASAWLAAVLLTLLLSVAGAGLARLLAAAIMPRVSGGGLGAVVGVLLLMHAVVLGAVSVVGSTLDSWAGTWFYYALQPGVMTADGGAKLSRLTALAGRRLGASGRMRAVAAVLVLAVAAGLGTILTGDRLGRPHQFIVTAHRNASAVRPAPPENSSTALRGAIDAGAQFSEIDVQESKDGVVMVVHDQDLSRLGGPATKIWDMTAEEIRAADIGTMAGEAFRGERIATLDEMLAIAKGRIKLNIELKFYGHDQDLAKRTIDLVKAHGMEDEVVFQSLSYQQLQKVRRIDSSFQVGYLMAVGAGDPGNLDVDFYSVEQGKADARFIRTTHRAGREVAAWTVDDSLDMARLGAMGVDNLITNHPDLALRVRALQAQMSVQDRTLKTVQAWLR